MAGEKSADQDRPGRGGLERVLALPRHHFTVASGELRVGPDWCVPEQFGSREE